MQDENWRPIVGRIIQSLVAEEFGAQEDGSVSMAKGPTSLSFQISSSYIFNLVHETAR